MPVVYTTAYYSLVVRGRLQRRETVLIHSGSGGVGQAAIAIALSLGCRVFTTVGEPAGPARAGAPPWHPSRTTSAHYAALPTGSAEKKAYLQARFPQLSETSFANSRDTSFEQHVLRHTAGKGEAAPPPATLPSWPARWRGRPGLGRDGVAPAFGPRGWGRRRGCRDSTPSVPKVLTWS